MFSHSIYKQVFHPFDGSTVCQRIDVEKRFDVFYFHSLLTLFHDFHPTQRKALGYFLDASDATAKTLARIEAVSVVALRALHWMETRLDCCCVQLTLKRMKS